MRSRDLRPPAQDLTEPHIGRNSQRSWAQYGLPLTLTNCPGGATSDCRSGPIQVDIASWPASGVSGRQHLPIGVSCDLLVSSGFVGSFEEFPLLEVGAGADESDEVRCVDRAPAGLCGLDELERHRDAGCS